MIQNCIYSQGMLGEPPRYYEKPCLLFSIFPKSIFFIHPLRLALHSPPKRLPDCPHCSTPNLPTPGYATVFSDIFVHDWKMADYRKWILEIGKKILLPHNHPQILKQWLAPPLLRIKATTNQGRTFQGLTKIKSHGLSGTRDLRKPNLSLKNS